MAKYAVIICFTNQRKEGIREVVAPFDSIHDASVYVKGRFGIVHRPAISIVPFVPAPEVVG